MKKTPTRWLLANNLRTLMAASAELQTQAKLALKAGIAQTSISQMLRPDNDTAKSPKLTQVEKVAEAFGLEAWQLLLNEQLAAVMMHPTASNEKVENKFGKAPRNVGTKAEHAHK